MAERHRATPIVARTWMQHAVPTVLGLEFAGWLDISHRHLMRVRALRQEIRVIQFGGAAGTLAALGEKALQVATHFADELGLQAPEVPWHAHRDRFAEVATKLALCTGTFGKIGRDLSLLSQTEVAEVFEPAADGRVARQPCCPPWCKSMSAVWAAGMPSGTPCRKLYGLQQEHCAIWWRLPAR